MEKTKQFKGTPGPWVARGNNAFWEVEAVPGVRMNVMVFCYPDAEEPDHLGEENEANANAIAAVPELLEAVQMLDLYLMEWIEGLPTTVTVMDLRKATDAALKKAGI